MNTKSPTGLSQSQRKDQQKDRMTQRLDDLFRWANMSDDNIEKLKGKNETRGRPWQRLAKAVVGNKFPHMGTTGEMADAVRPAMAEALSFAREAAPNIKDCAHRYEYFKSFYQLALDEAIDKHPELSYVDQLKKANEQVLNPEEGVFAKFKDDMDDFRRLRSESPLYIDTTKSDEEIVKLLRDQAHLVGMGTATSTIYHAHKHYTELPAEEREVALPNGERKILSPVEAYLRSLEKTLKEGEVVQFNRHKKDGGIEIVFEREISPDQGGTPGNDPPKKTVLFAPAVNLNEGKKGFIVPTMYRKTRPQEGPEMG